jgi:hypothetical protein
MTAHVRIRKSWTAAFLRQSLVGTGSLVDDAAPLVLPPQSPEIQPIQIFEAQGMLGTLSTTLVSATCSRMFHSCLDPAG